MQILLKHNILFWNEDIGKDPIECRSTFEAFENEIELFATEIQAATLDLESEEVGVTIAGYIAKKVAKRSNAQLARCSLQRILKKNVKVFNCCPGVA